MFIERLLNQGNAPLLEQQARFAAARHNLLADNIANISTPGYIQKDLDQARFDSILRERLALRATAPIGSVRFDDLPHPASQTAGYLTFHDRANRSPEQLMTTLASNALRHNMYVELLRKSFSSIEDALREKVG